MKKKWCKCKKPDLAVDINEPVCRICNRKWKPKKKSLVGWVRVGWQKWFYNEGWAINYPITVINKKQRQEPQVKVRITIEEIR